MEQRILPPDLENPPKLSKRMQTIAALAFCVFCLAAVGLVVLFQ